MNKVIAKVHQCELPLHVRGEELTEPGLDNAAETEDGRVRRSAGLEAGKKQTLDSHFVVGLVELAPTGGGLDCLGGRVDLPQLLLQNLRIHDARDATSCAINHSLCPRSSVAEAIESVFDREK